MKAYYKKPVREVRVVHTNEDRDGEYEIYILTPVRVGGARRVTANRIITDDGHQFVNMDAAVRHYMDKAGEIELRDEIKIWSARTSQPLLKLVGTDIAAQGKWPQFCKLRKLDARSLAALGATYEIAINESDALELQHDKARDLQKS